MLPNTIIIGAMKAGTTSLHSYLALHPDVSMSEPKELDFFSREDNWRKGLEWYAAHFEDRQIRGEASPNYTKDPKSAGTPGRMHSVVPDAKLIYLVRDPIDRIVSQYIHAYASGRVHGGLEAALRGDRGLERFIMPSRYHFQITRYLEFYERDRILVLGSEDLRDRRQDAIRRTLDFLALDADAYPFQASDTKLGAGEDRRRRSRALYATHQVARRVRRSPVGARLPRSGVVRGAERMSGRNDEIERPTVTPELRTWLEELLAPDIAAFRLLSGKPFSSWSV